MDEEGFARGNADELFRFRDQIADFDPDVVLVMSADHVYRLDYNDVLETHRRGRGRVHPGRRPASPEGDDPADHAVVEHDEDGRVTGFAYKPDDPASDTIACEVIAYDPDGAARGARGAAPRARCRQRRGRHRPR